MRTTQVLRSLVAVTGAVGMHLLLQAGVMLRWPGFGVGDFRQYYTSDQLAYLAIVANVAAGHSPNVEPYTLTGSIYYPRGYYVVIGTLARWTHADPTTAWLVGGLTAQALMVAAVGATTVLLTRRSWTGLLAFTPFVLGTGAMVRAGTWLFQLDSHAVLWGPFGVLFTLNGETVALSLGICAVLTLLLVGAGRVTGRAAWTVATLAGLLIGLLSGVQTYGFLTTVYVAAFGVAAVGLVRSRSVVAVFCTLALAVARDCCRFG